MAITIETFPSTTIVRERGSADSPFASTELDPRPAAGYSSVHAVFIDARRTPIDRTQDCTFAVFKIQVGVYFIQRFFEDKIRRGWFDPDPDNPTGYTADAPRDPSHWELDEDNVRAHEDSHVRDVVERVQARLTEEFNEAGTQEQLTIRWPCRDEPGAYRELFRLVRRRIQGIGLDEFRNLLRDFQRHDTNSETERRARRAQMADHEGR